MSNLKKYSLKRKLFLSSNLKVFIISCTVIPTGDLAKRDNFGGAKRLASCSMGLLALRCKRLRPLEPEDAGADK